MAARPIVILHGWSDVSASFEPLAKLLRARLGGPEVTIIHLADYISMENEVRFDDIVTAMEVAWSRNGLPTTAGSVDAIVHSTGGLVIRDWLQRSYGPGNAPVKHLVMLAPANFGSPLAHKGRSLVGRIWKGFIAKKPDGGAFQTGTRILKGLELASPYTWDLAERDRFGEGGRMYGPDHVLCTVLVGQDPGVAANAIANEDGWDGTVRVSTANLDCARTTVVLPANPTDADPVVVPDPEVSSGMTAFGVLDGQDHGSVKLAHTEGESPGRVARRRRDGSLLSDIVTALTVADDDFEAWRGTLAERNRELLARTDGSRSPEKHGYQNTVVRIRDQYGVGIEDFVLELFEKDDDRNRRSGRAHRAALRSVHPYSDDPSYRSFYIDCTSLFRKIDRKGEFLGIGITAHPEMEPGAPVGFTPFAGRGTGGLRIMHRELGRFFVPNRTLLLTLQLTRQQSESVFRLNPPDG